MGCLALPNTYKAWGALAYPIPLRSPPLPEKHDATVDPVQPNANPTIPVHLMLTLVQLTYAYSCS